MFIEDLLHKSLIQDIRRSGILRTERIIEAFKSIRRSDFMLPEIQQFAAVDEPFSIGKDQTISQPSTVAFMLELLEAKPGENIMDIGYGSGWQTALLAKIIGIKGKVYAIEHIPSLYLFGKKNLDAYNFIKSGRVRVYCKDGTRGLPLIAKHVKGFHKIIAGAAGRQVPKEWAKQLRIGGKLVMPIKNSLWVYTKQKNGELNGIEYPGYTFVPLIQNYREGKTPLPLLGVVAASLLLSFFAFFAYALTPPPAVFPKEVVIPEQVSAREASRILSEQNIVRSENLLLAHLYFQDLLGNIQPGTYFFAEPLSASQIASLITNPVTRKIIALRIPEGYSTKGMATLFEENNFFDKEEFWSIVGTPPSQKIYMSEERKDTKEFLEAFPMLNSKPLTQGLEGYLYPDTYEFFESAQPKEVVYKLLQNLDKKLREEGIYKEVKRQGRTLHEVLTTAALLEREAITYEDKRLVAGVVKNRLQLEMPLQLDAPLLYITGRGSKLLTKEDLNSSSPYNTYTSKGLPPGPIANPGIDSIKAALSPAETPYLYYLSDSNYTIHYSKTFEEHKIKKALYIGN